MMTFLFTPASERWLGWCKTENPQRDCFKLILWHLFFSHTSILFSVTCYQFWKLWTKKTPVRRTRSYEVESLPDRSLSFTNLWLETICQTHFLSTNKPEEWITGRTMDDYINSPTNCADVLSTHRCPSIDFFKSIFSIVQKRTGKLERELIKSF